MKTFFPRTGSAAEWNAAYYRLEDYLRAHLVVNKLHRNQIVMRLLQNAAAKHAENPSASPTTLALEEAWTAIDEWYERLLLDHNLPRQRLSATCRVSMLMLDATEKWPTVFLADEEDIPETFRLGMKMTLVQAGPDLQVSSMVPRPIDTSPLAEKIEEVWERVGRFSLALLLGAAVFLIAAIMVYRRI